MNTNRYFTNDSSSKPFTASEGIETKKYSGNPLLREVDEELKRLRSQFDKVASRQHLTFNASSPPPPSSNSYTNFSNYYPSTSSPQGSRIDKVQENSKPSYVTDSFQQNSFTSGRQNYHKDSGRFGATQVVGGTPTGMSSYGYQKSGSTTSNNIGSYGTVSGAYSNINTNTTAQKGSVITKTASNNGSFEFKSPKNLTSSGRHIQPSQQLQSQQSNISQSSQLSQVSPQQSIISASSPVSVIQVTNNQTFKLPTIKPEVIKVSSPQSQTIRINSPPKIRTGPTPAQLARNQQQARRKAQMQHIQRQRQLARQYQQQTTKIRQQKQKATNQRRQREQRESSISKNELGNYVTNINDKNKKISELESKISQMNYQVANAQNQAKRYKIQMQSLKNNQKSQVDSLNNTINNFKREIEILNRDKDRRNVDLENKINKTNFSYQEVNATNNRLNRQIENLKRQVERKSTNNEVNTNVFEQFKQKINEKTQKINQLEKQLDSVTENRNQLTRRVDELLLQGYEPKKEFNIEKLEKQPGAFDEILKLNLQQNQTYKTNLAVKDEQIFRLEEVNRTLKWENDRMRNEIEIEKLKRMTQLKNTQTTMDIEVQVKQNQINSLNHVINALEEKLKFIVQQDRKKDQFMVTYLKGRAEAAEQKQSVDEFFKQFELLSVNTNIAQCLKREYFQIQKLKEEIQKLYKQRR